MNLKPRLEKVVFNYQKKLGGKITFIDPIDEKIVKNGKSQGRTKEQ